MDLSCTAKGFIPGTPVFVLSKVNTYSRALYTIFSGSDDWEITSWG